MDLLTHQDGESVLKNTAIKLIDFGHSESHGATYGGSVPFNSPEKLLGWSSKYSDDMWSVGCTLLELYTGRTPFVLSRKYTDNQRDIIHLQLMQSLCCSRFSPEFIHGLQPKKRAVFFNGSELIDPWIPGVIPKLPHLEVFSSCVKLADGRRTISQQTL